MSQGPYGGQFVGDPYVPGRGVVVPQVQTIDATKTAPYAATLPAASLGGRLLRRLYIRGERSSTARLHVGDPADPRAARDSTLAGEEDTAEYSPEIFVQAGQSISIVWNLAPTGLVFATYEWIDL